MGCASSEPAVKSSAFDDLASNKQPPAELVAKARLGDSLDKVDTPRIQALTQKKDQTQYTDTSEALSSLLKSSTEVVIKSRHFPSGKDPGSSLHNALQSAGASSVKERSGQEFSKGLEQLGVQVQDGAVSQDLMSQVLAIVKSNQQIGEGSFGTVYKGQIEGVEVAVKTIRYRDVASARDEILASMALDHPNLVRTYLAFQHQYKKPKQHEWESDSDDDGDEFQPINLNEQRKNLQADPLGDWDADDSVDDCGSTTDENVNEMYIVQEFCNLGDLQGMILSGRLSGEQHLKRCLMISLDVANALTYMHKYKVLHLDMKPQNVLLSMKEGDRRPVCKIADFGVSRAMPSDMGTINTGRCGTAVYCPVEMVMNGQVSPTADVYSLALIMGEMMSGKLLYADISIAQAVVAVVNNGMRPELGDWVPEQLKTLLQRSWSDDRTQRPTAKQFAAELRAIIKALSQAA